MIKIAQKRKGSALLQPIFFLFVVFALVFALIFVYKVKATQIYGNLEDSVTVSCQAVCIHDRYISGSLYWNVFDVVFDTGSKHISEYYVTDPRIATKEAATLAYTRLTNLLNDNFSLLVVDFSIEEFVIVNIISGRAYSFDYISKSSSEWNTSEEDSYLKVKILVSVDLPAFGTTQWVKEDTLILMER